MSNFLLDELLACEHENIAVFETPRDKRRVEVCTDCGARRQPNSSRQEWLPPVFVHALQQEAARNEHRPISPIRDARVADAIAKGDEAGALRAFQGKMDHDVLLNYCRALVALNDKPEPGLSSWHDACGRIVVGLRLELNRPE